MAANFKHAGLASIRGGGTRSMDLGGQPRITNYGSWIQGVNAQAQSSAASVGPGKKVPSAAPQNMGSLVYAQARGITPQIPTVGRVHYPRTLPRTRLGPVPKLATGSGQTSANGGTGLGYSPAGYGGAYRGVQKTGMESMPYLQESVDSIPNNGGIPPIKGVAADDGNASLRPTYQMHPAHDNAFIARFEKMGRMPGAWEETAFGPLPRALQAVQIPRIYPFAQAVGPVLARPMSPNVYFLGTQTTPDVFARIGASGAGVCPLGY